MLMTKKLHNDTIQLLCKLINVNNLLYTYANVMQESSLFIQSLLLLEKYTIFLIKSNKD
jgi:hypothetical protein